MEWFLKLTLNEKLVYIPSDALRGFVVMSLHASEAGALLDAFDKSTVAFGIIFWPAAMINDEPDAYMILGGFLREGEM